MRPVTDDLLARVAAGDPARGMIVDERARRELWARIAREARGSTRLSWRHRARTRLRAVFVYLPVGLVLTGGALTYQPALCAAAAPCRRPAHHSTSSPHATPRAISTDASSARASRSPRPEAAPAREVPVTAPAREAPVTAADAGAR